MILGIRVKTRVRFGVKREMAKNVGKHSGKGTSQWVEEDIDGYHQFQRRIQEIEEQLKANPSKKLLVLFTGSKTGGGGNGRHFSWCPYCNSFESTLHTFKVRKNPSGHLLRVMVGNPAQWRSILSNPFRTDPNLKIRTIPTIMLWNTKTKVTDPEIQSIHTLSNLLGK